MKKYFSTLMSLICVFVFSVHCGGTGTGNPLDGNIKVASNPLAGPSAGFQSPKYFFTPGIDLMAKIFKLPLAQANVVTFNTFKTCNDTMQFIDSNGNLIAANGTTQFNVGQGLLTFSPVSNSAMNIGSLSLGSGVYIKEIDITFAVVPALCAGANYAIEFDDGVHGIIDITQNTSFKFNFSGAGKLILPGSENVTLFFGNIVNGMSSLGAGLNNGTIQTVNVGQAQ